MTKASAVPFLKLMVVGVKACHTAAALLDDFVEWNIPPKATSRAHTRQPWYAEFQVPFSEYTCRKIPVSAEPESR
ncbi:MAG: hypothetical protein ACLVAW_24345 [Eisenbergiella massiliensis]